MHGHVEFILFLIFSHVTISQTKALSRFQKPYCDVTAGVSGQRFNFSGLSTNDQVIKNNKTGDSLKLRLCEPLHEPCDGMMGYRVCLTTDGKEIGIGRENPDMILPDSGKLEFKFMGDHCKDGVKYAVHVTLKCDNEADNNSQPQMLKPHDSDDCNYHIVWETKAACGPEHIQNCTAIDNAGMHYDLSRLTLRSENYQIPVNDKSTLILNVCHSVVYGPNVTCQGLSGSCIREHVQDQNFTYKSWGDVNGQPFFDKTNKLTLAYDSGEVCRKGGTRLHVQSMITFICDHAATSTMPEYKGEKDCLHSITWRTDSACSIESSQKNGTANVINQVSQNAAARTCKVINPVTNIEYNLRKIMNRDFHTYTPNGTEYSFQVCGSVSDGSCPLGTGACIVKTNISAGLANSNLMWHRGGPYVNYTNGVECSENQHRYTLIGFFCGAEESTNAPIILNDAKCSLIIHWNTPLVCKEQIKCATKNGEVSLSSLTRSSENYVVTTNSTKFYINICRPLVPKPYVTCLHGSAACGVTQKAKSPLSNETDFQSLGYADEEPFFDDNKNLVLRYVGDSQCPENNRETISANLMFFCDYNSGLGTPRYKNYQNCTHVFEWTTRIVCGTSEGQWRTGCIIANPRLSHNVNLTSLSEKSVYNVKNPSGEQYNISICGGNNYCKGSAICKGDATYGSSSTVIFDYNRNVIKLKFSNGTKCKNGLYSSEVNFICDESSGHGQPTLLWEEFCSVTFEWKTNVVCPNYTSRLMLLSGEPKIQQTTENIKEITNKQVVAVVFGVLILACFLAYFIYLWTSEPRSRLRFCCSSMTSSRENCRALYTKVNATEEARLLLDAADSTQCLTDSDSDDELLDA